LAHGAAELPGIVSLLSENFCDAAYIFRVYDADCERLRFGFLAHVCDKLGNSHRASPLPFFSRLPDAD
jgi:hypothetical protein